MTCLLLAIDPAAGYERSVMPWIWIVLGVLAYWIPAINAKSRRHANTGAIALLNLFLGWTVIGWIVAMVWSATSNVRPLPQPVYPQQVTTRPATVSVCQCGQQLVPNAEFCTRCGQPVVSPVSTSNVRPPPPTAFEVK